MTEKTIHEGRNVKRFRELLGMKQEALADALGDDWNQKKISLLEAKETIEPAILENVAKVLKLPADAIRNFTEEAAYNIIGNTVTTVNDNATGQIFQLNPIINSFDKWMEVLEENKKLIEENKKLYQDLLKEKDEKIVLLEKMLTDNK